MKKKENLYNKIQYMAFLLLNIVDQFFKISTIVETLVTVGKPGNPAMLLGLLTLGQKSKNNFQAI